MAALLATLSACGGAAGTAASSADRVTKAIYANDAATVSANLDAALRPSVTRAEVGMLSDKMHALGDYQGLSNTSTDATTHEYTYRANFSKGSMSVVVRIDTDGKLAAYRVTPNAS